jgi:hypothetical protein
MLKLIIYKDKITTTQWESELNDWVENDIKILEGPITKYFDRYVFIKDDVTVEDFMNHLEYYEKDIDFCFSGYNNDVPLRPFLDEMKEDVSEEMSSDLGEIELVWQGEILNNTICLFGHILAFLSDEKIKELGEENDLPHDVSWLPINVWKHCKMSLNDIILINNLGTVEEITDELVYEGYHYWTFFDIVSNFLADITINGTPEERNKIATQIINKQYDVKEVAKNPEQATYWMSFLETELEEMKMHMEDAVDGEDYEKAEVIKKDMEAVEKELGSLRDEVEHYRGKK